MELFHGEIIEIVLACILQRDFTCRAKGMPCPLCLELHAAKRIEPLGIPYLFKRVFADTADQCIARPVGTAYDNVAIAAHRHVCERVAADLAFLIECLRQIRCLRLFPFFLTAVKAVERILLELR